MQISYFPRTKWHSSSANNETPEAGSCMYLCSGPLESSNLAELTFRPESRSTVILLNFQSSRHQYMKMTSISKKLIQRIFN